MTRAFHPGVNIIRGENSSGKSTILNFMFYALGGDVAEWSEHAQLCSRTYAEVELSGKVATLCRNVVKAKGQAMEIYPGRLSESLGAQRAAWSRYPYARTEERDSFSQALFRLLRIPEAASEQSGNITMHQVLRLMYADQLTPVDQLFKFEQFDSPALRDAVGRLMAGAHENEHYANRLRIRQLERAFDEASAEQRSLFQILGRTDERSTLNWIAAERVTLNDRLAELRAEIDRTESNVYSAAETDRLSLAAQDNAYARLQAVQAELGAARAEFDSIEFQIADARSFILDLEQKLKSLNDAEVVANEIGEVRFQFCPACYSPVNDSASDHACHLCKTPYDSDRARLRIVGLINDTALQLKQSRRLQRERERDRDKLVERNGALLTQWRQLASELEALRRTPSSEARARLSALQRDAGYTERQIEDLVRRESIAALIAELTERKESLNAEIGKLRARNEGLALEQQAQLSKSYAEIADEIRTFLRSDLPRQAEFMSAEQIQFSMESNKISLDGHSYFSASSRVVLRNSFFAGFLFAACRDGAFRHPRFCMMDSIEDKGMEQARSHRYQNLLVDRSTNEKNRHQLIFGTSMVAPDLDVDSLTVGKFSTETSKSLNFRDPPALKQLAVG